ncbi:ribosomal protein S6e [Encephalitozoon hellem]|nr:ribosomal protein S6e [Encephalitozoon hellem]
MKLNIAYPTNGTQKMFEIDRRYETRLYDKKIGDQFDGGILGEEFEGTIMEITGGDDYQGFPMVDGHLTKKRVRPLLSKGDAGYRCRRKGVRRRKSVRGSIVSEEICVLNLIILRPGEKDIDGLTNVVNDVSHLPRKESKLRKMFAVPDEEKNVVGYIRNIFKAECEDPKKIPKIRHNGKRIKKEQERKESIKKIKLERKRILEEERKAYLEKYFNKA